MKRHVKLAASLMLALALGTGANAAHLKVDGKPVQSDVAPRVINGSTYVSLRSVTEALRADVNLTWEGKAVARAAGLTLSARPGEQYLEVNDRALYVGDAIQFEAGRTLVPVRVLAKALGAEVDWDSATGSIHIRSGGGAIAPASTYYNSEELKWLSRIISAESQGEPLAGKIAVGNVILNRVKNREFPNSIYSVIFDDRWGGQFTPVKNGTIYQEPTFESLVAAKLCLEGANTVGESLYFLAPAIASNHWAMQNRPYVATIGNHWFYA